MKELNLTEEQKKLLKEKNVTYATTTFLEKIKLFKLTNSDGRVCCCTADLSECTCLGNNIEVVDGYVKLTRLNGNVRYYTADLSEYTDWIFGKHLTEVINGELKITPIITTITLKNN